MAKTNQAGFGNCGCNPVDDNKITCSSSNCIKSQSVNITVDVWDDPGCEGDNVVRVYNTGNCVYKDGYFYFSLEDMNVDMPPSSKWSEPEEKCSLLRTGDVTLEMLTNVEDIANSAASDASEALALVNNAASSSDVTAVAASAAAAQLAATEAANCCNENTQTLENMAITSMVNSAVYESVTTQKTWGQSGASSSTAVHDPMELSNVVSGTAPATVDANGDMVFTKAGTYIIVNWYNALGPTDLLGGVMSSKYNSISLLKLNGAIIANSRVRYTHHTSNGDAGEGVQQQASATVVISVAAGDVLSSASRSGASGATIPATSDALGVDASVVTITELISTVEIA